MPDDWSLLFRARNEAESDKSVKEMIDLFVTIEFLQNSIEEDQTAFLFNVTTFTPAGISIHLNFSEPLLVSQGEQADQVRIRLLKDFFLRPDPLLRPGAPARRLQVGGAFAEDEEYVSFLVPLPKQVGSAEELAALERTADLTSAAVQGQFAISFVLSFLLKGVMGALWDLLNMLQLVLLLPMRCVELCV